jgi:acyl-[acyl-carrier-protein]-phospholipid O-acyltransferase/long-chain-fatty-acid--[acyl-carrier-protein] ligase
VLAKTGEILVMLLGVAAFLSGSIEWMFGVLFLMAAQSTFFGPAKNGILPELFGEQDLSRANGLVRMTTFAAIVLGTTVGSVLMAVFGRQSWVIGTILVGLAVLGTITSRRIDHVPRCGRAATFRWNPWAEIGNGIGRMWRDRRLKWTAIGIVYFWFIGALIQLALLLFASESLGLGEMGTGALLAVLAIGIAAGSMAAGQLSGGRIDMGIVPPALAGIGVASRDWLLVPLEPARVN